MSEVEVIARRRAIQTVRGVATAAVALIVAAVSHSFGGGAAPSPVGVSLATAVAVPVSVFLAGRRLSALRMMMSVGASQFAFHTLFALSPSTGEALSVAPAHHVPVVVLDATVLEGGPSGHHSGSMWIAHAIAALVTFVILFLGERAVWGLFALAGGRAAGAAFSARPHGHPHLTVAGSGLFDLVRRLAVLSRMRHRGPPITGTAFISSLA